MCTDKFIENLIEAFTNKVLNKDYGYILGTYSNIEGYEVWKKVNNDSKKLDFNDYTIPFEQRLKITIDFLNN